jgi:branched-chain amino acid transport system substrate-binding protein
VSHVWQTKCGGVGELCLAPRLWAGGALRVGFIGGLSDRNSDVGQAGNNGVVLAVEQINRAGGIRGRQVELISRDDAQNPATAEKSARELAAAKVDAVIGPFTSGVAAAVVPVLAQSQTLAISPTLTSMAFYGKDDNLVRINRSTRDNAGDYARVLYDRGQHRIAVAYDVRNRNFTESWLEEFRRAFTAIGGTVARRCPMNPAPTWILARWWKRC